MKIKLVLKDECDQAIWANAERTARRVEQWPAWKREGTANNSTQQPTPHLRPVDKKNPEVLEAAHLLGVR